MSNQGLFQSQTLRQEQRLAPAQLQSLEILTAPLLELQTKITQELAVNPILEQADNPAVELIGDGLDENKEDADAYSDIGPAEDENSEIAELAETVDKWQYDLPANVHQVGSREDEEKLKFLFDSITGKPTIQEQLLDQVSFLEIEDPSFKELLELIIGSLDHHGYFCGELADLAILGGVGMEEMEKSLDYVQGMYPAGVGARNLKECLLLQLRRDGRENSVLGRIVENHLADIANNQLPKLAKNLNISMEELRGFIKEIHKLNPYPCSVIDTDTETYVVPELSIVKEKDEYVVQFRNDYIPKLQISDFYLGLLEDSSTLKATKDYIKEKLTSGRNFIHSIENRESTVAQIADILVDTQHDFFEGGVEYLRPLTMRQVADKIGIHETTVGRAIANKFVQTNQGIFELKYFFNTGYQSESGELISNRSVMEKIKEIIAEENTKKPYSDEKIAKKLKEYGLSVARRTVTKYREEMEIPVSRLRKTFD